MTWQDPDEEPEEEYQPPPTPAAQAVAQGQYAIQGSVLTTPIPHSSTRGLHGNALPIHTNGLTPHDVAGSL